MNYSKHALFITILMFLSSSLQGMKRLAPSGCESDQKALVLKNVIIKNKWGSIIAYKKPAEDSQSNEIQKIENGSYSTPSFQKLAFTLYLKEKNLFLEEIPCSEDSHDKLLLIMRFKTLPLDIQSFIIRLLLGNILDSNFEVSKKLKGWDGNFSPDGKTFFIKSLRPRKYTPDPFLSQCSQEKEEELCLTSQTPTTQSQQEDSVIELWNLSGNHVAILQENQDSISSAVFSFDGQTILTGSQGGTARLWSALTGEQLKEFRGEHTSLISLVLVSPDEATILTGSPDETVCLWNLATGRKVCPVPGISKVTYNSTGKVLLILCSDLKTIHLWSLTGKCLAAVKGRDNDEIDTITGSSDGNTLLVHYGNEGMALYDLSGNTLMNVEKGLNTAEFSPDGNTILTVENGATRANLFDLAGNKVTTFKCHESYLITSAGFSRDGNMVYADSFKQSYNKHSILTYVWDLAGNLVATLRHTDWITGITWSYDSTQILTWSDTDSTVGVWNLLGNQVARISLGRHKFIDYIPKGNAFLTESVEHSPNGKEIHLWNTESSEPAKWIASNVNLFQARFIVKASQEKIAHNSYTVGKDTVEHEIFKSMPLAVQTYLTTWYTIVIS
ncbi:hypothetical protein H0W26_00575 [Candidatus Dependentiae bacterium]|nr:hypothetical protein [Candidatus Dependentiae bacterium]